MALSVDGSHQYDRIRRKHDKAIAIIRFKSLERRYPERPRQRGGRWLWLALGLSLVGSVAFAKWAHAEEEEGLMIGGRICQVVLVDGAPQNVMDCDIGGEGSNVTTCCNYFNNGVVVCAAIECDQTDKGMGTGFFKICTQGETCDSGIQQ